MIDTETSDLAREAQRRVPEDAAALLRDFPPERVAAVLRVLPAAYARRVQAELPDSLRAAVGEDFDAGDPPANAGTIGALTEPTDGVVPSTLTAAEATTRLRAMRDLPEITYLYVTGPDGRLVGLVVMRDLLLAAPDALVSSFMLTRPYAFAAGTALDEAGRAATRRHYPVYPVVDADGRLLGQVRGWRLFEHQVEGIAAQSGSMVGVGKEEHVHSPFWRAFRLRHPWLQLNLFTGFIAALVVSRFEATIAQIVILAAFLPVLASQSGNTGCQALAITLRGLTLGDLDTYPVRRLIAKEMLLGALNGAVTGVIAGIAIVFATGMGDPRAPMLALVIFVAMVGACIGAGIVGVLVPLLLRRVGADPVTASSIILTTMTDIASMGLMLFLASLVVGG